MKSAPERDRFDRIQTVARLLLLPYVLGIFFAGSVTVGYFAYGLAHASDSAGSQLLGMIGIGVATAIALPLLILLPGRSGPMRAVKTLGMVAMCMGGAIALRALWYSVLEPAWMTHRFNSTMDEISIEAVHEAPLYLGGQVAGVRLRVDMRLARELELDRYGRSALEVISDQGLFMAQVQGGSQITPLSSRGTARKLTKDGGPVSGTRLPAGRYENTRDYWLPGVEVPYGDTEPCRSDETNYASQLPSISKTSGQPIQAVIGTRFALRDRLGYRYFERRSPQLKFRYDHARWMSALPQLPIEQCSVRAERKRLAEQAEKRAEHEKQYAAGDPRLAPEDNPLYQDICADDLGPLRQRLAAGTPKYPLSGKLWECAITKPRLDLFALLMPVMHARVQEREEYCSTIRELHGRRMLDFLAQLVELKLPLACEGEHRNDWQNGISPHDVNGSHVWEPPAAETLRWLQLLRGANLPICAPFEGGGNLLGSYIAREPAPTIELLLDAGCDPLARPAGQSQSGGSSPAPYSPSLWWAMRRFTNGRFDDLTAAIDPSRVAAISRRMGDVRPDEINAADPVSGRSFLHDYGRYAIREPDLLLYLVSRGARLDAASHNPPLSWYGPGYNASDRTELRQQPLLDRLSNEQLLQLISPIDAVDRKPAQRMAELDNFSDAGLGRYLCKRGVIPCAE